MKNCRFEIEPFKGTNLLKLGLTSEEYKDIIGVKPEKFQKSYSDNYVDELIVSTQNAITSQHFAGGLAT